MMKTEDVPIIYRSVYKCGGCNGYVSPTDITCSYCGGFLKLGKTLIEGIVIDNLDMDIYRVFGDDRYKQPIEFDITMNELNSMVPDMRRMSDELGVSTYDLTREEQEKFLRTSKKMVLDPAPRGLQEIYKANIPNTFLATMIAKKQLGGIEFDGDMPAVGRFGVAKISPRYLGHTSWLMDVNTGSTKKVWWIHAGAFGGTQGNAIRVQENAVFIIFGFGDMPNAYNSHISPITGFNVHIDGGNKPIIEVGGAFQQMEYPAARLSSSYILKQNTCLSIEVAVDDNLVRQETNQICPYPIGYVFTLGRVMNKPGPIVNDKDIGVCKWT